MAMAGSDRSEDCAIALPRHTEPSQQLFHGAVVRDEQPITVECDGEVPVADLEGDANRLVSRSRRHDQHGLLRRLDDDVVVGTDVEHVPRRQRGSGRQCQRELPPVRGLDPPPPPSALFRGEDEPIAIDSCNRGLCIPLDPAAVPNAAKLYSWAVDKIGGTPMVVATSVDGPGIIYNMDTFAQNHLKPPTSWNDLWRADLNGRVTIPAPESTMGLGTLVMLAKLGGGGETNIAPGFEKVKSLLPHIQRLYTWSSELAQLLQLNEVWMASTQADLGPGMRAQGFPAAWVAPKEGAPMVNGGMSAIANAPYQDASLEYVNLYVSPEFQALRARHGGNVPTNTAAWEQLSPAERSGMAIHPQDFSRMIRMNWTAINRDRAKWVEQWHRTVQR